MDQQKRMNKDLKKEKNQKRREERKKFAETKSDRGAINMVGVARLHAKA